MKKLLHHFVYNIAILAIIFLWMPSANAHPLGNFTINHYAGLQVRSDGVGIDYVLDMAEIPAFQEINHLDINQNRKTDSVEIVQYPSQKCNEVKSHLELLINKQPSALSLEQSLVEFPPGVGGLSTLRLSCNFQGLMKLKDPNLLVEFKDNLYPQRLGWREITVTTNGVSIQGNFTSNSISNRLRDYPNNLLSSPFDQHQISFKLNPSLIDISRKDLETLNSPADLTPLPPFPTKEGGIKASLRFGERFGEGSCINFWRCLISNQPELPVAVKSSSSRDNALTGRSNDIFTSLITQENHNFLTICIALAIAFLWGGLHALSPGHGKTVVGAYLVGSRSNAYHALFLGLIITITHTSGIFALGLVTLGTSQFILTEELYPWLSILSGVMVTVIGLNLLISRWQNHQVPHSHDHVHDHSHSHDGHHHPHHSHSHLPPSDVGSMNWSSLLALGISGGLLPCPSALVVLLSAIALGRIGFGLALVSAFSLGLAVVLTGIGLILVYAKDKFEHLPFQMPKIKILPMTSALCITLIGLGITAQALLVQPWK